MVTGLLVLTVIALVIITACSSGSMAPGMLAGLISAFLGAAILGLGFGLGLFEAKKLVHL
jgi:hypothetical protein